MFLLRESFGLTGVDEASTSIFERRGRMFLVDNERGKRIAVRLGEREFELPDRSNEAGHFASPIRVPAEIVNRHATRKPHASWRSLRASVVFPQGDERESSADLYLLDEQGISVVSDIDDTIKVSDVRDKRALAANTFLREFVPVPGMAEAYRAWAERGAAFHYVSSSPWQLYPELNSFVSKSGFPEGTFHLKPFRVKDEKLIEFLSKPDEWKPKQIEPLLAKSPKRQFVFIGDSGEKDPEIYGELARKHRGQVVMILIRNVTGEEENAERFQQAFKDVPMNRWMVFDDPKRVEAAARSDQVHP